jgi:hypothetical protein
MKGGFWRVCYLATLTKACIKVLNRGNLILVLDGVLEIWILSEARCQMSETVKRAVRRV